MNSATALGLKAIKIHLYVFECGYLIVIEDMTAPKFVVSTR